MHNHMHLLVVVFLRSRLLLPLRQVARQLKTMGPHGPAQPICGCVGVSLAFSLRHRRYNAMLSGFLLRLTIIMVYLAKDMVYLKIVTFTTLFL